MLSRLTHLMSCFFLVRVGYTPTRTEKMGVAALLLLFAGALYYMTHNLLSPLLISGIPAMIFFAKAAQNEKALASSAEDEEDDEDAWDNDSEGFL